MYLPKIDEELCTNCGECIDVCPTEVIAEGKELAVVSHPEECLGCESCIAVCPEDAVSVEEV